MDCLAIASHSGLDMQAPSPAHRFSRPPHMVISSCLHQNIKVFLFTGNHFLPSHTLCFNFTSLRLLSIASSCSSFSKYESWTTICQCITSLYWRHGRRPNPGKAIPVFFSVSNIKMGCSPMMLTPGPPLSSLVSKYVLPKRFSIFALVSALIHDRVTSQQPSIGTAGTMCIVNWLINTLLENNFCQDLVFFVTKCFTPSLPHFGNIKGVNQTQSCGAPPSPLDFGFGS